MKILHLAESGAFGMERTIEHGKRVVAAGWFVKWGYDFINNMGILLLIKAVVTMIVGMR